MLPEELSMISRACQLLTAVRAERTEADMLCHQDGKALITRRNWQTLLLPAKRRQHAEMRSAHVDWYLAHDQRLIQLQDTEADLIEQIHDDVHMYLMDTDSEYQFTHKALTMLTEVLQRIDHATQLGRRASELIHRAQKLFEINVAHCKMRPGKAATATYVHVANAAMDRFVTELYCGLNPRLRDHAVQLTPWEALPGWDAENNCVSHAARYHLVDWCLEQNAKLLVHPTKGMLTGIQLAEQRIAPLREHFREQEKAHRASLAAKREHMIDQLQKSDAAAS